MSVLVVSFHFEETVMKQLVLASLAAAAIFGVVACSDNSGTDTTTTQSTNPPATEPAPAPAQDNAMKPVEPKPADPAAPKQ